MNQCSGLCKDEHKHKNAAIMDSEIHHGRTGVYVNPNTKKKERISYDTHKRCNACGYWVAKQGQALSHKKKCPCCNQQYRVMPRYSGGKEISARRERVRVLHKAQQTPGQEQGVMP